MQKKIAKCDYCGQFLIYKTTVTNLKKHIQRLHPNVVLPENLKIKTEPRDADDNHPDCSRSPQNSVVLRPRECQKNLTPVLPPAQSTDVLDETVVVEEQETTIYFSITSIENTESKKIDKLLLQLFTHEYYSFSIVEETAFINLLKGLNPSYTLPTRKIIKNSLIPAEYNKCQAALHQELMTVNSVCFSIDTWTSVKLDNYMGLTAHYITEILELRSVLLECLLMPLSLASTDLAELMRITTDKFNLSNKVSMVVSSNLNFSCIKDAVIKELEKEHFVCFAHTLNIILQNALKTAKELIDKIKYIVRHFRRNSSSLKTLNSAQKMTCDLEPKKLVEEIPTRWNSTFYMIQHFTELQDAMKKTIDMINKDLPVLTEDEWETCKELCVVLEPFEEITEEMCKEHYLAGSLIIPLTNGLKNVCEKMQEEEFGPITKRVIAEILKGINTQVFKIEDNKSFALATFLDPRFKLIPFSNELSAQSIKEYCISLMTDTGAQQQDRKLNLPEANHDKNQGDPSSNSSVGRLAKFSVWENFEKKIASKKTTGSMSAAMIEINTYIEDTFLGRKEDPLLWWKNNQYYYPLMTKLVKTKFNIMGSSLPCKNLFTKAGNLKADRRSRLKAKHMEKLLFLNANSFLIH